MKNTPNVRDTHRYGFSILEEAGFGVEAWDVSKIHRMPEYIFGAEGSQDPRIQRVSTLEQLRRMTRRLTTNDTVVVVAGLHNFSRRGELAVLSILGRGSAWLTALSAHGLPTFLDYSPTQQSRLRRVRARSTRPLLWPSMCRRAFYRNFARSIPIRRKIHLSYIRPFDQIWVDTKPTQISPTLIDSNTDVTEIHALDYDKVLAARGTNSNDLGVVFLDAMGPLHPDYELLGIDPGIDVEMYGTLVRGGLKRLSERTGLDITVAAHPKAQVGQLSRIYGEMNISHGNTCELVARSKVVACADGSTSIGFAVALAKPLVLLVSERFQYIVRTHNHAYETMLRPTIVDLDNSASLRGEIQIDEEAYASFMEQFVKKSGSPNMLFWVFVGQNILARLAKRPPHTSATLHH